MASSYKIKRSKESKALYCVLSVLALYRYINLFRDNVLDKTKYLLLFFHNYYTSLLITFVNKIKVKKLSNFKFHISTFFCIFVL